MKKILVVEDDKALSKFLQNRLKVRVKHEVIAAHSFQEAEELLIREKNNIFVALLDYNLPDAPDGQVIDRVLEDDIAVVVFTGMYDDDIRDELLSRPIVDYVYKKGAEDFEYAISLVERIEKNQGMKVLVVDDSRFYRELLQKQLRNMRFEVLLAEDGEEALEVLEKHPDVKLVLTDYNMPRMDGYTLTTKIRRKFKRNDLAIIAITGKGNEYISSRFLKYGANDYLDKPFSKEELMCRINLNIEAQEALALVSEHNRTLQQKVKEEVAKNFQKDRMLELQDRHAQMGEMISSIAHQWRQPLNSIGIVVQDFAERMAADYGHPQEADSFSETVMELLDHMSRTMDDFRDFFRPSPEEILFPVRKKVAEGLRLVGRDYEKRGITVSVEGDDAIKLLGSPNEFLQVVLNLLNNARDALEEKKPASPTIGITVAEEGESVVIRVADNAGGIPPKVLANLFEPYLTTKKQGTGIGLYMSRAIVEKMRGQISADNSGEGAVFTLRFDRS